MISPPFLLPQSSKATWAPRQVRPHFGALGDFGTGSDLRQLHLDGIAFDDHGASVIG
jgi:hypothetical protein